MNCNKTVRSFWSKFFIICVTNLFILWCQQNFLEILSLLFLSSKVIIKQKLWSIMHKSAMLFLGLRGFYLYAWLCALPPVENKNKHLMRLKTYYDFFFLFIFFLAALKEHKSICILKSTESNYGSLSSSEFHLVECVEESPAILYGDTFIIWSYFCVQTKLSL